MVKAKREETAADAGVVVLVVPAVPVPVLVPVPVPVGEVLVMELTGTRELALLKFLVRFSYSFKASKLT